MAPFKDKIDILSFGKSESFSSGMLQIWVLFDVAQCQLCKWFPKKGNGFGKKWIIIL